MALPVQAHFSTAAQPLPPGGIMRGRVVEKQKKKKAGAVSRRPSSF